MGWRPVSIKLMPGVKTEEDSHDGSCHSLKRVKVMSPGSVTLPTMPNWDMGQSLSPFCPPDMNSIASGSMMTGLMNNGNSSNSGNLVTSSMGSPFDSIMGGGNNGSSGTEDWNGLTINPPNQDPLSNLMDSVNSLDPLNSMGKSLNEQMNSLVNSASSSSLGLGPNSVSNVPSLQSVSTNTQNHQTLPRTAHTPSAPHTPHTPGGMINMGQNH